MQVLPIKAKEEKKQKRKGRSTRRAIFFVGVALVFWLTIFSGTVFAGTVTITGVDDSSTFYVPRSLPTQPVFIDDDATISGTASFADGYLYIKPTSSRSDDVIGIKQAPDPNAYNAVSVDGDSIYIGTGSKKIAVASIDSIQNGRGGKGLKINFFTPLPNGSFEEGYNTWSFHNERYDMPGDSGIKAGTKYCDGIWGFPPLYAIEEYKSSVESYGAIEGNKHLKLSIRGNTVPNGKQHGPWVESAAFSAKKGDSLSLYFSAKNTGDKYDVYGYLVDKQSGAKQQLFYERGDDTGGWKKVTSKITLPGSDNFAFQFICGSQDGTGGQVISSELLIDGVKILKEDVNAQNATIIARSVQFVQASAGSARPSIQDRNFTFEAKDSEGGISVVSKATVKIHTWPETPTVVAAPVAGTTDSLNASYSSALATTYDVYLDEVLVKNNVAANTASFGGLGINTPHEIKVIATNDMGDSDETALTKYTNAAPVEISSASSTSDSVTLTIQNHGNPVGTEYCLERSNDGVSGWTVTRDFDAPAAAGNSTLVTDSSNLQPNTRYYYRAKARNGDDVQTVYSDVFGWYTGPAAPDPVTVTPRTGTTDTLDVSWGSPVGAVNYDVYMDGELLRSRLAANKTGVTGLNPDTRHSFKVVARNATEGTSLDSSTVSKYTYAAVPTLVLNSADEHSIDMGILKNENPADIAYLLERSIDGENYAIIENYTIKSVEADSSAYTDTNLNSGTVYYYRVKTKNGDGVETLYSTSASKITLPAAPTGLTVRARIGVAGDLIIGWTAPMGAESFDVYRKGYGESVFTKTDSAVTETGVEHLGLTPNRNYEYYVIARNESGNSFAGSMASAYTNAAIPGISSANVGDTNNLTILNKGSTKAFSAENPDGTKYYIEHTTDGSEVLNKVWQPLTGEWISYLSPQHSGIDSGKTYSYRVKAINSAGVETEFSDLASARSNASPVVDITSPSTNIYQSEVDGHTTFLLSGTVSDADGDVATLKSTINGIERTKTIRANATGVAWTLSWDVVDDVLAESVYSDVAVEATDDYGGYTQEPWTQMLIVDNTNPQKPSISAPTDWTNDSSVPVRIANGTDLSSGASYTEYSLTGATLKGWTLYAPFNIENEGVTTIHARTVDKVGNCGPEQTQEVKIDRTAPVTEGFILESTSGVSGVTSAMQINIRNISATDPSPGSGNGDDAMTPKEMMISNATNFSGAVWEEFSSSRSNWSLASGENGVHTVYIKVRDAVGESATMNADILVDGTPPVITISQPSTFIAKKGAAVTYSLNFDEECDVEGMDNSDNSNIELTYSGSFSDSDQAAIWNALAFEQIDGTYYRININLPATITANGMIGMKARAGLATDVIGNQSVETPGNTSFAVDANPPNNQNELFTADRTVRGGQAVALAKTSQSCTGGYGSDSVRFAPSGYTGTQPANSMTITSTHGTSTVINAPTEEGNYYLYVIDAAGNISARSTYMLTVKNDGPSVTVSGAATWVKASASVDYLVTFGADTDPSTINLVQQKISLVTSGTANAYVAISQVSGQPYQRRVTLTNLMGDGTIAIKVAAGTAKDAYNNPTLASNLSEQTTVDNIPPTVDTQGLVSNNSFDTSFAKVGDKLTLDFSTNEEVSTPIVMIQGTSVTPAAINAEKTSWRAELTVTTGEPFASAEGSKATFSIVAFDKALNASETITQAGIAKGVTYDFHAPVISVTGDKGLALDVLGKYKEGVSIAFNEGNAVLDGGSSIVSGTVVYDEGMHTIIVTDAAGQTASKTFDICYDSLVLDQDESLLEIGYAEGDSANSVTRNVKLPGTTDSGAAVSWLTGSTEVNAVTGAVTRPAVGQGDAEVVLIATITKNGYSEKKTFNLKVIEAPDASSGLGKVTDDAGKAKIYFAYGDSAHSVTQNLQLGSIGLLNNSVITWTSSDPETIAVGGMADVNNVYNTTVTQPPKGSTDRSVTLTATAIDPDDPAKTAIATFALKVKPVSNTSVQDAQEDYNEVSIAYADGDAAQSVTRNITLVDDVVNGSHVTWQSSAPDIITSAGVVTRPSAEQGSSDVVMSASISNSNSTITKVFSLRVIASDPVAGSQLDDDKAALAIGYFEGDHADSVTTHVVLPVIGEYGSEINWQSDRSTVIAPNGTVARQGEDVTVVLTATIEKDGVQESKVFNLTVKAISEDDVLKQIKEDTDKLAVAFANDDSKDSVTDDLMLRAKGANGCDIKWASARPDIVETTGLVNAAGSDTQVVLTAQVSKYSNSIGYTIHRAASFTVNVVSAEVASIDIGADLDDAQILYAKGDNAQSVTAAMYFATVGKSGAQITWVSDNRNYVSDTGLVTRPTAAEGDKKVTIRATITNPISGASRIKVFEVTVKKLTDQEAVEDTARVITIDDAVEFSTGDYWESVTSSFWTLLTGKNDTSISWSTSNSSVVELGELGSDGRQTAQVNRQTDEDKNVILTATIRKGVCTAKKTFMLIVKNVSDVKIATREDTLRTIDAILGNGLSSQSFTVLQTSLTTEGGQIKKVDTVVLDREKIDLLTSMIDPEDSRNERTVLVMFDDDAENAGDEQTVEVPSESVKMLSDKNASLRIDAGDTEIFLDLDEIAQLAGQGTDLYMRIVPLTDEQKQAQVAAQAKAEAEGASLLGVPYMIDTNFTGVATTLIIPVTGTLTDPDYARVYVQHNDGTTEILTGAVVYKNGRPSGIQISIDHFSTFLAVELPSAPTGGGIGGGQTPLPTPTEPVPIAVPAEPAKKPGAGSNGGNSNNGDDEDDDLTSPPTPTATGFFAVPKTSQEPVAGDVQNIENTGEQGAQTNTDFQVGIVEIGGKYYALIDSVAGKSLVLVCEPEDMPTGSRSEVVDVILKIFGRDIDIPKGEFTLSDLAAVILQKFRGVHAIVGN